MNAGVCLLAPLATLEQRCSGSKVPNPSQSLEDRIAILGKEVTELKNEVDGQDVINRELLVVVRQLAELYRSR